MTVVLIAGSGLVFLPDDIINSNEVLENLKIESGEQFDPRLCAAFIGFLHQGVVAGNVDPVCGMLVDSNADRFSIQEENREWAFCSQTRLQFSKDHPEKNIEGFHLATGGSGEGT